MDDEDTHLLAQLRVLCREESVAEARGELAHLIQAGLPPKPPKISKLLHLALRRDVWALQACRPAFGISQVPPSLQLFRSFDKVLTDCLKDVVRRTEQKSRGLPLHSLAGPWEGGHEAAAVENARPGGSCAQAFAAWNAQGAFGRSANEARNVDRMLHFAAQLLHAEVTIAVVAEPKLGEHASWPRCTGFKFFGLHTHDPASVAVLVHEAVAHAVSVLSDYGDECASWVAVEGQPMVLLLAVYGPHTGHPNQFRQEFWYKRLREYHSIRCLERYKDCPLTILGDTNLHFPFLGPTNQRMARPLDRQILSLFESPAAFHTTIRNLPSVATHASGSVIDLVAAQESLSMDLEVTWLQEDELRSDHAFVVCRCRSASIPLLQSQHVGVARWGLGAAWDEATDAVKSSLSFASAWAACALGDTSLRDWVSQGKFKRARLNLLDRVVWWRSVLLTLAGHFKGLVWLQGTRQPKDLAQELWPFMAADLEEEGGSEAAEDLLARLKSSLHEEKVARFTKLSASNQQEAQAYLSRLLKPKEQLQTKLCEKGTGRPLSDFETLAAIADDVIARGHAGHEGVPAFDACIQSMVAQARTTALASSLSAPPIFICFRVFIKLLKSMQTMKASAQLPRKAVVAGSEAGRALTWAIINLIFFIGLVPSSWFRVISPIRKRGPEVVTKQECLRPICYVSDLEGAFDMVWLHLHKQLLIDYAGSEQVGGQTDPVLVSIGFLISLRSRLNSGLPSLLMKADLLQGYDLAWRDAVRVHAWLAGVQGRGWLLLDASLSSDVARVRLGPLLGPFFVILNHGIRQGGRSTVQLFGAFAKGLTQAVASSNVGVGLGHDATVTRCVLGSNRVASGLSEPRWEILRRGIMAFNPMAPQDTLRATLAPEASKEEALLLLDAAAKFSFLQMQFVDDAFVFQSTPWGLFKVCAALSNFAVLWHHRFAAGKKAASLLCVGEDWPETLTLPILDGEQIRPVQQLEVLGTSLDKSLSLEAGLSALGQRLHDAGHHLGRALEAQGLGIAWHAEQFPIRAESAALFGCELLAACVEGWPVVARRLNQMHYRALKALLGIANLSLGDGGYSLMLTWLGYQWRLSAKVGLRIVTALARLLTLPPHSLLHEVVRAAAGVTGETWVESARGVARSFGVETIPSWETLPSTVFAKADVKLFIQNWKRACVIPAISAKERLWQQEARSKWPRNPPAELRQALSLTRGTLWTPRLARACKAWFLALLTGRIFLGGWHRGDTRPDSDQRCWLCESRVTDLCDHLESQCEVVERVTASAGLQRPGLFSLPEDAPRLRRRIETLDCIMTAKQD